MKEKKHAVVLSLSGGMDSSTLLLKCINEYENVVALSFDYGQKHKIELQKAKELVDYINKKAVEGGEFNLITHRIIKLDGLSSLLNSTLVEGGDEVPEGHYQDENMKETVVPNRNKMFSSIIQAVALSMVGKEDKKNVAVALGIHSGDHDIYPDCRAEFRKADFKAFQLGNWNSEFVKYYTPYLKGNKLSILRDGEKLCKKLKLDFDEVYFRTNTSYKPIFVIDAAKTLTTMFTKELFEDKSETPPEGNWYSDYKSASSVERIEAFIELGRPDPINYADETGPVTWEYVEKYVKNLINKK